MNKLGIVKWISRLYVLFLGVILSITTGFGIAAIYPQPVSPTFPTAINNNIVPQSCNSTPQSQSSADCQALIQKEQSAQQQAISREQEYQKQQQEYQNKNAGYTRTAIFFGIVVGATYALLGLVLIKKSKLVATGLLLGGLLTAILTRILISMASLGASVSGTSGPDMLSYAEFFVLFVLSIVVIFVGLSVLKADEPVLPTPAPAKPPQAPEVTPPPAQ